MNILRVALFLFALFFASSESARILGLFTSFSKSHVIVHMSVARALIDQGHDVTIVTTTPLPDKNPKFKHILLSTSEEKSNILESRLSEMSNIVNPLKKVQLHIGNILRMVDMQYDAIKRSELQEIFKKDKFDLLVLGSFFNEFQLAVAAQLKVPVVFSWLITPIGYINSYAGNPNEMSYVPNILTPAEQPMTFTKRILSFIGNGFFYGVEKFANYKFQKYYE